MQPFNLLETELKGTHLIEAGAGTGKTYTITGLFLRLLLEQKIPADRILAVTFTKAATQELKERIRRVLTESKKAIRAGGSSNDVIDALIQGVEDLDEAAQRIQDALRDFDGIAIYTIHGFCQRLLYEHAFETGDLFDTELITDQTSLMASVAEDYWRQRFYSAPPELISYALSRNYGPQYFYALIRKARHPLIRIIPEPETPVLSHLNAFRSKFSELKAAWRDCRENVAALLKDPSLSGTIYGSFKQNAQQAPSSERDIKIMKLLEEMDRFTHKNSSGIPAFQSFEKFTAEKIKASVKKAGRMISHRFFDLCDEFEHHLTTLESEIMQYLVNLGPECLAFADRELSRRKKNQNVQFFDDLLLCVYQALNGDRGNALADGIRAKYHAALVDEFQDTDQVQFGIFSKIFSHEDSLLFMIGDPKQSIYSFRGADVFSYMKASSTAQKKHTLLTNYRSTPALIQAVNTLFSSVKQPFVFHEIPFACAKSAKAEDGQALSGKAALTLWWMPSLEAMKPIRVADAVHRIAQAVAAEISGLIHHHDSPVAPGDIAVLVRTNRQADVIRAYLADGRIPCVHYSAGNVFDTREALELERVLTGIANAQNPGLMKAALLTGIMGVSAERLDPEGLDADWWETVAGNFMTYRQEWNAGGFFRMFSHFLSLEKVRSRLLSFPDGERRLTNLLHLSEMLHAAAMEKGLGIAGLLKWLRLQMDPQSLRLEAHQLRLESDGDTVKIITIHKSKGLEYSVVFCPYAWSGSKLREADVIFHDIDAEKRLTLDLGSPDAADHRILAQNELLAENLRLLYVALTRAPKKCYLAWGRINTAETSAMAYLLHGLEANAHPGVVEDIGAVIAEQFCAKKEEDLWSDLENLQQRSRGSIEVLEIPAATTQKFTLKKAANRPLALKAFSGRIDKTWRISSYSSFVFGKAPNHEMPDRDALGAPFEFLGEARLFGGPNAPAEYENGSVEQTIFSFPKGAAAGIFFHDVLEHSDFTVQDAAVQRELVADKLKEHGFSSTWQDPVLKMIQQLRTVPLKPGRKDFTLSSIPLQKRLNELSFFFPLSRVGPERIKQVFAQNAGSRFSARFPEQLDRLVFSPTMGFMKGYIDVVFEYEGKFYVADWKSNFLGGAVTDYGRAQLEKEMLRSFYTLQYHLYALATHMFLKIRKADYDYERDFGGVFYFFIRGIDAAQGPAFGIFEDRPAIGMMDALGRALIPGYAK
jgi:exodeoxyribonuclease V beta subunit